MSTHNNKKEEEMTIPMGGSVAPQFEAVRDAFEKNFVEGEEVGASFCVYQNGEKVVDLWGGYADKAKTKPWQEHSLTNVWSTTKGMAAIVIARLVEQGRISYENLSLSIGLSLAPTAKKK